MQSVDMTDIDISNIHNDKSNFGLKAESIDNLCSTCLGQILNYTR